MRFKKYLTEKWIHSTKVRSVGKSLFTEIFYNPSRGEYRDAAKASTTGAIPAMRGRLATGFILPSGDVWLWRGDIWHYDLDQASRNAIGKGMKGFHFGFSKNEVSFYTSKESGQITPSIAQKLRDRLATLEPRLKSADIYLDDMDIDSLTESQKICWVCGKIVRAGKKGIHLDKDLKAYCSKCRGKMPSHFVRDPEKEERLRKALASLTESRNIPGHMGQGSDVWEVLLEPQDTPPETDSKGNYILYHGTILSTAKEIIKTKLVKLSKGWGTGVTTTPWEAKSYAGMKRIDVGGLETGEKAAVLQMVIDKDWLHKQVMQREVGGHFKNEFLIRGDIVPKAIKKIKIWRIFP
jgi:hypothetical protein